MRQLLLKCFLAFIAAAVLSGCQTTGPGLARG
jgi:hypothetical protein